MDKKWVFRPDVDNMTISEIKEMFKYINLTIGDDVLSTLSTGLRTQFHPIKSKGEDIESLIKTFNTLG